MEKRQAQIAAVEPARRAMPAGSEVSPDASEGRYRQRRRTRAALVAAAATLLRSGHEPSVAEAAEAADISRATAYRYFPSQDDLVSEAMLELSLYGAPGGGAQGLSDQIHELADAISDHQDRVCAIVRCVGEWSYDNQVWLRRNLRSSLHTRPDQSSYVRPGHRLEWIDEAVAPMAGSIRSETLASLRDGLTTIIGVEAIVALTDVGRRDRDQTLDSLEWTARALTAHALTTDTDR